PRVRVRKLHTNAVTNTHGRLTERASPLGAGLPTARAPYGASLSLGSVLHLQLPPDVPSRGRPCFQCWIWSVSFPEGLSPSAFCPCRAQPSSRPRLAPAGGRGKASAVLTAGALRRGSAVLRRYARRPLCCASRA